MSLGKSGERQSHTVSGQMATVRAIADVFDEPGTLFFCMDASGRILQANSTLTERFGDARSGFEPMTLGNLVAHDQAGELSLLMDRLRAGETIFGAALVFLTCAGERVAMRGMLSPRVEDEQLISALATFTEQPQDPSPTSIASVYAQTDPGILETLVESSPDGALIVNADLEIVAFNRNLLEIWGLDEETVRAGNAGAAALRIIAAPDVYVNETRPFYANRDLTGDGVVRLIDGRMLDWHTRPAYRSDGEYLGRGWYYRDATDRLQIEEELQRTSDLYRQLAMHFPNGAVFLYDHRLVFLLADGSALADLQLSRSDIEGRALPDIFPGPTGADLETAFRAALSGCQTSQDLTFGQRTYTVTTVPISTTSRDGRPRGMAIMQDVSNRRSLEAQLRATESRLRSIVEQIPAVTYVQEVRGSENVTIFISPQVEQLVGYTPDELLENAIDWIETIHPDDREMVFAATSASNVEGTPFSMEYRALTKDGDVVWVRDEAAIVRDHDGVSRFWQGIIFDITEERKLEEAVRQSEERFRSAFDEAPMGIVMVGLDGAPKRFNNAMALMLGYSEGELLEFGSIGALTHPDDLSHDVAQLRRLQFGEVDRYRIIKRFIHRDGNVVWTQMDVSYVFNGEREPEYILAQVQDISEKHRLEEELRQSEAVFRSTFDYAAIGMARVALDGSWLDVNASLCEMLGYSREELLKLDFQSLTYPDDLESDLGQVRDVLSGAISSYHMEKRYVHKSGATIWGALSVSLVRSEEGQPLFFISQIQDVTAKKALEEQLDHQAHHDGLTGLLNRHGLMKLLECPATSDDEIGILVIDMDGFKEVNDRYGHDAGDRVLQVVARRIRGCLRNTDQVARLGGDEFVVALGNPVSPEVVERLAKRIQAAVARPIRVEDGSRMVTVQASIGSEIGPRDAAQTTTLKLADDAMYRVKRERHTA